MRFICDHDVDAEVAARLRQLGHQAWTAAEAGLSNASDDALTVYACDRGAILLSHDREFGKRRRRNVVGQHIWLRCREWDAADLLEAHLKDLAPLLRPASDLFIVLSAEGFYVSRDWQ